MTNSQEQDIEVGRDRPPTPLSDPRGPPHSRLSDSFPWHQQRDRNQSHAGSHYTQDYLTGEALYQNYGPARSSASFMTLDDKSKGLQAPALYTPEMDRFARRRRCTPMADLDCHSLFI